MTFKPFLAEGLIKLPPKIVAEATKFLLEKLLAYLSSYEEGDKLDREVYATNLKRFAAKHDLSKPSRAEVEKAGRSKLAQTVLKLEIPESYVSSIKRLHKGEIHKASFAIKYVIVFSGKHELLNPDESGAFIEKPPTLLLNINALNLAREDVAQQVYVGAFKEIERRIEYAVTTLEHELTHAVQFMVLKQLHPEQVSSSGTHGASDKGSFDEIYYTSQLEFDPQLKSSLKDFEHLVRRKGAKTKEAKRELLHKFTWSDTAKADIPDVGEKVVSGRSPFFQSLKRVDHAKWKKALKLFSTKVNIEELTK